MQIVLGLCVVGALWLLLGLAGFAAFLFRAGWPRNGGRLARALALGLLLAAFAVLGPLALWLEWAAWRRSRAHPAGPVPHANSADGSEPAASALPGAEVRAQAQPLRPEDRQRLAVEGAPPPHSPTLTPGAGRISN